MEVNPPPYNPDLPSYENISVPTAPSQGQIGIDVAVSSYPSVSPTFPQQTDGRNVSNCNGQFFNTSMLDESNPPPEYSPPSSPAQEVAPPINITLPPTQPSIHSIKPLRCKSGTVEIGDGNITDIEDIRSWKTKYIEVRDCVLFISPARNKPNQMTTIPLKDRFISMPGKRLVAIQAGYHTLVLKTPTEVRAHQWFVALSQYCYVAPMMEGYCDKLSRGKKVFEERFLRLCSDGVLSWFKSDSEDSERRGSIQLRGEKCIIDVANPNIVQVQVEPKGYQFRFNTPREAQLWLVAFQWHYGRKPLRKASVPLRNKAK